MRENWKKGREPAASGRELERELKLEGKVQYHAQKKVRDMPDVYYCSTFVPPAAPAAAAASRVTWHLRKVIHIIQYISIPIGRGL